MAAVDGAITASSMEPACPIENEELCEALYGRQARAPCNLTGHPALAVPTGFAASGVPLSMQIIGKSFDAITVYRVARAYARAADWLATYPALG